MVTNWLQYSYKLVTNYKNSAKVLIFNNLRKKFHKNTEK